MAFTNYGKSPEESKRISWLSIFSSILQSHPNCNSDEIEKFKGLSYEIADELYDNYSVKEMKDTEGNPIPFPSGTKEGICKACGSEMKRVPAGTSKTKIDAKTGKPKQYAAFWSCPNRCRQV